MDTSLIIKSKQQSPSSHIWQDCNNHKWSNEILGKIKYLDNKHWNKRLRKQLNIILNIFKMLYYIMCSIIEKNVDELFYRKHMAHIFIGQMQHPVYLKLEIAYNDD